MKNKRSWAFAVSCSAAITCTSAAFAEDTWTEAFPGVWHLHRVTADQNINVLEINLCHAGIGFRATRYDERGQRTSDFASSIGAQAAVNGDFFVSGFELERGFAAGEWERWPDARIPDDPSVGQLAIGENRLELLPDWEVLDHEDWMAEVVGGRPTVLDQGWIPDTSGHATLCKRNPRTAIGLSEDRGTLFVAVVDGRASTRVGMTCTELGELMQELGAHDALNLDGGGSSTMWLDGDGVVNYPTDGRERTVANHLAIYATGEGPPSACPSRRALRKAQSSVIESPGRVASSSAGCGISGGRASSNGAALAFLALFLGPAFGRAGWRRLARRRR